MILKTPDTRREFASGANRDVDTEKLDFEGFLAPEVLEAYAQYMNYHRHLPDGTLRDSDNWQKGWPLAVSVKSLIRHVMDLWLHHRGHGSREGEYAAVMGALFNLMSYARTRLAENSDWAASGLVQLDATRRKAQ